MSRKFLNVVGGILLGASLLLSSASAFAQGQAPNAGPGSLTINPGQQLWYSFQFGGGDSATTIDMHVEPHGTASFSLWNPERLTALARGDSDNDAPIGQGTVLHTTSATDENFDPGDLHWSGALVNPDNYSVLVENKSSTPATFTLNIRGDNVSQIVVPAVAASAQTANHAQAARQNQAARANGSGPGSALPIPAGFVNAAAGSSTWYAIQYPGGDAQVEIEVHGNPHGSFDFSVWTPEGLREAAGDSKVKAVGRGTHNKDVNGDGENSDTGDLTWNGTFAGPGTYYVVVDKNPSSAGDYTLKVNITPAQ